MPPGTADALRFSWLRYSALTFAAATLLHSEVNAVLRCEWRLPASLVTGLVEERHADTPNKPARSSSIRRTALRPDELTSRSSRYNLHHPTTTNGSC